MVADLGSPTVRYADRAVAVLLFATVAVCAIHKIVAYDVWWQLAAGRYVLDHGFPTTDPFSFATPDRPWVELRWLFFVVESGLFTTFGLNAIIVAKACLLLVVFGLLWCADPDAPLWTRCVGGACALALAHLRFVERPEIVTFLLLSYTLVALVRYRAGGRNAWIFALPLLQIGWTNAHTLFVLGPITIAIFAGAEIGAAYTPLRAIRSSAMPLDRSIRLAAVAAASTVACVVNPYGIRVFAFAFQLYREIQAGNALAEMITEFRSPLAYAGWTFTFVRYPAVIAVSALALVLNRRSLAPGLVAVYAAFLYLSLQAERNLALFGLVAGVATTVSYGQWTSRLSDRASRRLAWTSRAVCTVLAAIAIPAVATDFYYQRIDPARRFGFGVARNRFPIRAIAFADAQGITGRILADLVDSNYVLFARGPKSVLVDGRLEVYTADALTRADKLFRTGEGFDDVVAGNEIAAVVVSYNTDGALFRTVNRRRGWIPIYFDETHALFVRETPETKTALDALRIDWAAPVRRDVEFPPRLDPPDWLAGAWPHVSDDVATKSLGQLALLTGNLPLARERFAEALDKRPDDADAALHLGVVCRALGDDDTANRALARAGSAASVPTADSAAGAFAGADSLEAAAATYDAIIARGGGTPDVYDKLAQVALAANLLDDAERAYQHLSEIAPNAPQYVNALALVAVRRGATDEAVEYFARSLAIQPRQPAVYTALASLRLQRGDREGARAALARALEIDPNFKQAREQMNAIGNN